MKMHFFVLSTLLKVTTSLLITGYFIFAFSLCFLYFNQKMPIIDLLLIIIVFAFMALQHFFYIRVKLDAEILHMLYQEFSQETTEKFTEQLDQSLIYLNLMPEKKSGRAWDLRFKGCLKLFKLQIITLCLQATLLFISIIFPKL